MFSTCARLLLTVFWVWFSFLIHFSLLGFRIIFFFFLIWFLMFFVCLFVFLLILVLYCRYWGCEDEGEIWLNSKCFSTMCVLYVHSFLHRKFYALFKALYDLYVQSCLYRKCSECPPRASKKSLFDSTT